MPVVPRRNLPPDSEPWGRWVETKIGDLDLSVASLVQDNLNSFKALNGTLEQISRQIEDLDQLTDELAAQQASLAAQQETLAAQQESLAAQQANLAARITTSASISSFNTGILPNDSTEHFYGPSIPITVNVPTGKLVVTVGCGEISVNPGTGTGAAAGLATFGISGVVSLGTYVASVYTGTPNWIGSGASVTRSFSVPPGTYTVTGQMIGWASATPNASVNFTQPYLTVQVTG